MNAFGWEYRLAEDEAALRAALAERRGAGQPGVIEVRTDGARDETLRREVVARVQRILNGEARV